MSKLWALGNFTVQYCSSRTCAVNATNGRNECTCDPGDTCRWRHERETGRTDCTRAVTIQDTRPPVITLLGPALVERFEAGRGAMCNGFDITVLGAHVSPTYQRYATALAALWYALLSTMPVRC